MSGHPVSAKIPEVKQRNRATVRNFRGMNNQAHRTAIEDGQFVWLENAMPIGFANLRAVPHEGAALNSVASGVCNRLFDYNLSGVDYMAMFCDNGAAYQVQLSAPYTRTTIGAAGTFAGSGVGVDQWKNERIVITDGTNGYRDWSGAALTLIDAAKVGNHIAVNSGRVWIANNRTVNFTDVDSYNSFLAPGGSFVMTDPQLKGPITALKSANNFLYIFGTSSINALADVRVSGGITLFSNTNLQASVGSDYSQSLFGYYRSLMFGNTSGFHALVGSNPKKVSDEIDGLMQRVIAASGVSGGQVMIHNILCAAFAFQFQAAQARPLLALLAGKDWFVASQGAALTLIRGSTVQGVPRLYGTDGTTLYQLFADSTAPIATKLVSKFYEGADSLVDAQIIKFGIEVVLPVATSGFVATVESERNKDAKVLEASSAVTWINNLLITVPWANNVLAIVEWVGPAFLLEWKGFDTFGKYYGVTLESVQANWQLSSMNWEWIDRASW